eukprot:TRINITY_DN10816_c0_g1_i1.p1 TRINITY_DN10816_c0_g1~~TRINITY_DN10816_c0_g1_i1.p1  ORF type:complete len:106 (-),score=25.34 TRINITY_DN10816_c0_g1_i1:304-621(-)
MIQFLGKVAAQKTVSLLEKRFDSLVVCFLLPFIGYPINTRFNVCSVLCNLSLLPYASGFRKQLSITVVELMEKILNSWETNENNQNSDTILQSLLEILDCIDSVQ